MGQAENEGKLLPEWEGVRTADEGAANGDISCLRGYGALSGLHGDGQSNRGPGVLSSFVHTWVRPFCRHGKFAGEGGRSAAVGEQRLYKLQGENQDDAAEADTQEEDQVFHRRSPRLF